MCRILSAESTSITKQLTYAEKLFREGFYDLASIQFQEILDRDPVHPAASKSAYFLAESAYRSEAYADALKAFSHLIVSYTGSPWIPDAYFQIGQCYEKLNRPSEAIQSYTIFVDQFTQTEIGVSALFRAAKILAVRNQNDRAIPLLHLAIQRSKTPDQIAHLELFLAQLLLKEQNISQSVSLLQKLSSNPTAEICGRASFLLGNIYKNMHQVANTIQAYEQAIAQNTSIFSVSACVALAELYNAHGHSEKSQKYIAQALKTLSPDSVQTTLKLVHMLIRQKRFDRSLVQLRQLQSRLRASDTLIVQQVLFDQAICLKATGDVQEAIAILKGIVDAKIPAKLHQNAMLLLSACYLKNNQSIHAACVNHRFLRLYPNHPLTPYILMTTAKYYLNDAYRKSEGLTLLSRIWQDYPAHPLATEACYRYAMALLQLNRLQEAVNYLELCTTEAPWSSFGARAFSLLDSLASGSSSSLQFYAYVPNDSSRDTIIRKIVSAIQKDSLMNAGLAFQQLLGVDSLSLHTKLTAADLFKNLSRDSLKIYCNSAFDTFFTGRTFWSMYPPVLYMRSQRLIRQNRSDQAIQTLQVLMHEHPESACFTNALHLSSSLLMQHQQFNRAIRLFDQMLETDSLLVRAAEFSFLDSSASRRYFLLKNMIRACFHAGQLDHATRFLTQFRQSFAATNDRIFVNRWQSRIAEKQNRQEDALFFLTLLSKDMPSDTLFLELGHLNRRLDRFTEAVAVYKKGIALAKTMPVQAELNAGIILCLINQNKLTQADTRYRVFKKTFQKILRENDLLPEIDLAFGLAHLTNKDFETALTFFKRLKDKYRGTSFGLRGEIEIGHTLLITNHTDEALDQLIKLTQKHPNDPLIGRVYLNLGDHYFRSQQYQNAIAAFKNAITEESDPEIRPLAMRYLIRVYETVGLFDAALGYVRQYIRQFPYADDLLNKEVQIGLLYFKLKDFYQAIHQLSRVQPRVDDETEAEVQYWIAKSYLNMGQLRRAISEFLKVKYISKPTKLPWGTTAVYEAGKAYVSLGEPENATKLFKKVMAFEGVSELGRAASQQIEQLEKGMQ